MSLLTESAVDARPLGELVRQIKAAVAGIRAGWVEVEIEKVQEKSGHLWLQLAGGEDARVDAVIWRSDAAGALRGLAGPLKRGDKVAMYHRRVDFYGPRGDLRLIVTDVVAVGEGELLRRREAVIARLRADGLCGRRRPLPVFPRRIGLIAPDDSEALVDAVTAIRRRFPPARILHVPARVQGQSAPSDLIRALMHLENDPEVDVIAVVRGGGSVGDLVPFDDEELCRIIAGCQTPVITAVGHTRNWPACNEVAAVAAEVPAAVAEHLVPSATELLRALDRRLRAVVSACGRASVALAECERLAERRRRAVGFETVRAALDRHATRIERVAGDFYRRHERALDGARAAVRLACQGTVQHGRLDRVGDRLHRLVGDVAPARRRQLDHAAMVVLQTMGRVPSPHELDGATAAIERAINSVHARRLLTPIRARLRVAVAHSRRALADQQKAFENTEARAGRAKSGVIREPSLALAGLDQRQRRVAEATVATACQRLLAAAASAKAHDPSERGYALVRTADGSIVSTSGDLTVGKQVAVEFRDGRATAQVKSVEIRTGGTTS